MGSMVREQMKRMENMMILICCGNGEVEIEIHPVHPECECPRLMSCLADCCFASSEHYCCPQNTSHTTLVAT